MDEQQMHGATGGEDKRAFPSTTVASAKSQAAGLLHRTLLLIHQNASKEKRAVVLCWDGNGGCFILYLFLAIKNFLCACCYLDSAGLKEQVPVPVYHPTPSQTRLATQLTEEEQIRIAQRIGLIQHLPKGVYDPGRDGSEKKIRECVICMMDFVYGDPIRFLPCMHIYHLDCIDDWLMRSFTCPSCMEPVDAALLSSYETN
nr:RING finger protein 11 [Dromaius novaehollandiae]